MRCFTHFEAALGVCKVDFCGSGRKNPGFTGKARQTPRDMLKKENVTTDGTDITTYDIKKQSVFSVRSLGGLDDD
jgi:hypothetical protein